MTTPELKPTLGALKRKLQESAKQMAREHQQTGETWGAYADREYVRNLAEALVGVRVIYKNDPPDWDEKPIFVAGDIWMAAYKAELFKLRNPKRICYLCRQCQKRLSPATRSDYTIDHYGCTRGNNFCTQACATYWADRYCKALDQMREEKRLAQAS